MTIDLIPASKAPAAVASALDMREGGAAGLIEQAGLRPFRQGMRHWYRRSDIDALVTRQEAPATCRLCGNPIRFPGGIWTGPEGTISCMSGTRDYDDHQPKEQDR